MAGPHSGSAKPPGAARRALRRHRGELGHCQRGYFDRAVLPRCDVYCKLVHGAAARPCSVGAVETSLTSVGMFTSLPLSRISASSTTWIVKRSEIGVFGGGWLEHPRQWLDA